MAGQNYKREHKWCSLGKQILYWDLKSKLCVTLEMYTRRVGCYRPCIYHYQFIYFMKPIGLSARGKPYKVLFPIGVCLLALYRRLTLALLSHHRQCSNLTLSASLWAAPTATQRLLKAVSHPSSAVTQLNFSAGKGASLSNPANGKTIRSSFLYLEWGSANWTG